MTYLFGVDEAGRGPLAGPVAVGILCAPEAFDLLAAFPGLNDSKKLSEKRREVLFSLLEERVAAGDLSYVVELRSAPDIDEKGIAVVIREAIATGLEKLEGVTNAESVTGKEGKTEERVFGKVWLDGALRAPSKFEQETVIGGDALIPAIMLASVAAKVTRDRLMVQLANEYPQYGFEKHKGYGTSAHMALLREHGLCAIHRASFIHLEP